MVFSCQSGLAFGVLLLWPHNLGAAGVGFCFRGTATSTRGRVRPAIIDCCRSATHEAPLHKRLPHPCALLSGHPWPSKFRESKTPLPRSNIWRMRSFLRRLIYFRPHVHLLLGPFSG